MSRRITVAVLAVMGLVISGQPIRGWAQANDSTNEFVRKARNKVEPVYPDLARRMNIVGTVKIQVVVAPNGSVKEARVVGGHPVLANAALDAAKKWRFEPSASESTGVIDFRFEPR